MHKSKLAGFIIDCNATDLQSAAEFWSRALGMEAKALPGSEGEKYVTLVDPREELHIEVQKMTHPSRVHLDIETDDIEAEVGRLKSLGAKKVGEVGSWCVMEAPAGQKFCVVRNTSSNFDQKATQWGSGANEVLLPLANGCRTELLDALSAAVSPDPNCMPAN